MFIFHFRLIYLTNDIWFKDAVSFCNLRLGGSLSIFQFFGKENWKLPFPKLIQNIDQDPLFTVEDFSRDLRNICMTKFAMLTNVCLTEPLSSLMNPNEKILGQSTRSMRVFQNVIANTNIYIQIIIFTGASVTSGAT